MNKLRSASKDIEFLFSSGNNIRAYTDEVFRCAQRTKTARYFLLDFHHANIPLSVNVFMPRS